MKIAEHVLYAFDDAAADKFESAVLHACIAVDATARRLYPGRRGRARYVRCLRQYYWLLEPMMGSGINLEETKFENVKLGNNASPDFAEIIYEVFRCSHAHGDEIPQTFSLIPTTSPFGSQWLLADGELHMPDRVLWALLALSVFSTVNAVETSPNTRYLALGENRFVVADWWGREAEVRHLAQKYNKVRVKLDGLDRWDAAGEELGPVATS